MIVFTGLSGSGKSSLAFDTIFAEGQRRYVESLSAYARQFLGNMQKPDVDEIEGLSPAISIDQKAHSANPRSTVATITEIYDYLRVLYARVGEPYCPLCKTRIAKMTIDEMCQNIHLYLYKQIKIIYSTGVHHSLDMKKVQKEPQFTLAQKRFIKKFVDIIYENMAIEHETPFSRQEAYRRYRRDAIDLIKDGTYKTIRF